MFQGTNVQRFCCSRVTMVRGLRAGLNVSVLGCSVSGLSNSWGME